jgi:hypothetical protein
MLEASSSRTRAPDLGVMMEDGFQQSFLRN